jgi:hypothetical protein
VVGYFHISYERHSARWRQAHRQVQIQHQGMMMITIDSVDKVEESKT